MDGNGYIARMLMRKCEYLKRGRVMNGEGALLQSHIRHAFNWF